MGVGVRGRGETKGGERRRGCAHLEYARLALDSDGWARRTLAVIRAVCTCCATKTAVLLLVWISADAHLTLACANERHCMRLAANTVAFGSEPCLLRKASSWTLAHAIVVVIAE